MLADDLFRIAHDDGTGKPRLHPAATRLGLAAALLTELLLEHRVAFTGGCLYVTDTAAPRDALTHAVLDDLLAEPTRRDIGVWLAFLAHTAYERVTQRLLRAGHIEAHQVRGWRRRTTVYLPADSNDFATPGAVLTTLVERGTNLGAEHACLAALVQTTGLGRHTFVGLPKHSANYLTFLQHQWWPDLAELLAATHIAIARAVISHRV